MLIFNRQFIISAPLKWRGLVNIPTLLCITGIIISLGFGIWTNWNFKSITLCFIASVITISYLASLTTPILIQAETMENELRIVYRELLFIHDVRISYIDLQLDTYQIKYGTYGRPIQLFIQSASNKKVELKFQDSLFVIGKFLNGLSQKEQIMLQPKELAIIDRYKDSAAQNRSATGKIVNIIVVIFILALLGLIFYGFFSDLFKQ